MTIDIDINGQTLHTAKWFSRGNGMPRDQESLEKLEIACVQMLATGQFREAAKKVVQFELALPEAERSGLNVPWHWPSYQQKFMDDIDSIKSIQPKILGIMVEADWQEIQNRAAFRMLFGRGVFTKFRKYSIRHLDGEYAANMIIFSVGREREVSHWASLGVTHADISKANDCCNECKAIPVGPYLLSELPNLPHAACTGKYGCRCMPLSILD